MARQFKLIKQQTSFLEDAVRKELPIGGDTQMGWQRVADDIGAAMGTASHKPTAQQCYGKFVYLCNTTAPTEHDDNDNYNLVVEGDDDMEINEDAVVPISEGELTDADHLELAAILDEEREVIGGPPVRNLNWNRRQWLACADDANDTDSALAGGGQLYYYWRRRFEGS